MKLISFFLLIVSFQVSAQSPVLIYAKSLSDIQNNIESQFVNGLDLDVTGSLYLAIDGASSFNIGTQNSPNIIQANNNLQFAAILRFTEDQYSLGGFGFTGLGEVSCDSEGLTLVGQSSSTSNFNFSEFEAPDFYSSLPIGNRFFCRYDLNGLPQWSLFSNYSFWDGVATDSSFMVSIESCVNCSFEDAFGEIVQLVNSNFDGMMIEVDYQSGEVLNWKTVNSSANDRVRGVDYSSILHETTYALQIGGDLNLQWNGENPLLFQTEYKTSAFVTYDSLLECSSVVTLKPEGFEPQFNTGSSVKYDASGNLYGFLNCSPGDYILRVNDLNFDLDLESPFQYIILKFSPEKQLLWIKVLETEGFNEIREIYLDDLGFIYVIGSYQETLAILDDNESLNAPFVDEAGFVSSFRPDGEILWLNSISTTNRVRVIDLDVSSEREMFIGGGFQAFGHDFNFESNVSFNLGNANGYDPFIAKYQLPEITPDLFVSKRYEGVGVSEDGATDLVRLRLSKVPESSVSVELTPDAQLNLGNGVGVPIILEFAADESAILEQVVNIAALNDLVVEGLHTGLISISMTSADPAFNNLSESPISVSIIDNDVMSVEERNEFGFIISPNPASNFIEITCTQKPDGVSLIEIIDIQGKKVYSQNFVSNIARIDLSQYSKGTYTVSVRADNQVIWREGVVIR